MTIAVDLGRKVTKQTNKTNVNVHFKLAVELEIYINAKPVPVNKTLLYRI